MNFLAAKHEHERGARDLFERLTRVSIKVFTAALRCP